MRFGVALGEMKAKPINPSDPRRHNQNYGAFEQTFLQISGEILF